jgi:hypothetical protein
MKVRLEFWIITSGPRASPLFLTVQLHHFQDSWSTVTLVIKHPSFLWDALSISTPASRDPGLNLYSPHICLYFLSVATKLNVWGVKFLQLNVLHQWSFLTQSLTFLCPTCVFIPLVIFIVPTLWHLNSIKPILWILEGMSNKLKLVRKLQLGLRVSHEVLSFKITLLSVL